MTTKKISHDFALKYHQKIYLKTSLWTNTWTNTCSKFFIIFLDQRCIRNPAKNPPGIYLLKDNNRNTRIRCKTCSKLTIKLPKRRQWCRFDESIVNISYPLIWVRTKWMIHSADNVLKSLFHRIYFTGIQQSKV